jgi:hypothetical protein
MPYPTYEDARAHERELLRLAKPYKTAEPMPERRRVRLSLGPLLSWLERRAPAPIRAAIQAR